MSFRIPNANSPSPALREGGTHRAAMGGVRGYTRRPALTRLRALPSATLSRGAGEGSSARSSVQPVEAHRAAGEDTLLRRGRGALQPLAHHVGRAGEKPVAMRVVGCPHDLVGADIIGEHIEATLDRLERDPAIALEQFARPRLEAGIVEALIVEMPIHPVEPRRDPAAARF